MSWFDLIKMSKVDLFIERYLQFNADVRGLHDELFLPTHVTSANEDNVNIRIKKVIKNYRSILKLGTRFAISTDDDYERGRTVQVKLTQEERKQYEEFIQDLKDLIKMESSYESWKKDNE
jgi:hypothetical protein